MNAQRLFERLCAELAAARADQQTAYWHFTRSARGKPVPPAITENVCWLERNVAALRVWLAEQAVAA